MDDRESKLAACRARQQKWMQQRQAEIERQRVMEDLGYAEIADSRPDSSASVGPSTSAVGGTASHVEPREGRGKVRQEETSRHGGKRRSQAGPRPEEVIDKLTERITDRLREELKGELERETANAVNVAAKQGQKLEGYLATEIESHTCPICYELMRPPDYAPHMLFPCGHTFCAHCLKGHMDTHQRNKCPLCRQKITSKALNHSLQDIIQNFMAQKERVQAGRGVSKPSGGGAAAPAVQVGEDFGLLDDDVDSDDPKAEYERKYRTLDMRCRILRNELTDSLEERNQVAMSISTTETVRRHLKAEQDEILNKIETLKVELNLIQSQVDEQDEKERAALQEEEVLSSKIDMIQKTLQPLEEEVEKLGLILRGLH